MKERKNNYPNDYAKIRLREYFNQLSSNKKFLAKRKLGNTFLSGNKSSVIKKILEEIIITK